ncbi:enoyl-CoA hydratase [Pararhodobacter sp. CCB-MM2]|uniref:enoyl-CoA hydratase n=1 Tax=Pararhodobacter sp. CCB-MM2 TaxID=1786003 RepID=UPI00083746AA|nr:enoyl-CoA hydratase [Pararhodobacter sp. CCB-MM2]
MTESMGIRVEKGDGILSLIFDRAEKKNAITAPMYAALADGIEAADADPAIRVVLIRSEGDTFSAGNDIADFVKRGSSEGASTAEVLRFLQALARAKKPLVAAVQGKAVGVGTTMLLHCDYVILSDDAALITPFVNLALVPEAASSLLLPARIGHLRAFGMFALGEPCLAPQALAWGLANRVVPLHELHEIALGVAARLAAQPPAAVQISKSLMRESEALVARMAEEGAHFNAQLQSGEAQEAFAAFAERRKPDFSRFG